VTANALLGIVSHFDPDPGLLGNLSEDGAQRFECGLLDAGKIDARRPCRREGVISPLADRESIVNCPATIGELLAESGRELSARLAPRGGPYFRTGNAPPQQA
jgi:hypothetical protein